MDQLNITDTGEIGSQPLTWDGEPLYSQSTVQEGLFKADAFEQFRGQTAMDTDAPPVIEGACSRCGTTGAQVWNAKPCACGAIT